MKKYSPIFVHCSDYEATSQLQLGIMETDEYDTLCHENYEILTKNRYCIAETTRDDGGGSLYVASAAIEKTEDHVVCPTESFIDVSICKPTLDDSSDDSHQVDDSYNSEYYSEDDYGYDNYDNYEEPSAPPVNYQLNL